ncbi:MAG: molybdate ABC transporter substrate-binding protein [Hyphomonadaceae bacterium]|jgi:molybdenum ABC transporter molybdate-binding protein|nr:molybdate ABC transporter substrate-binding protein [Hyphomonadaceae bacterium]
MRSALLASALLVMPVASKAENVNLYAAGSLKTALSEVVQAFERQNQGKVRIESTFGASGLLRERIEKEKAAHVFASADLGHPTKLVDVGLAGSKVAVFARNQLCALAKGGVKLTSATLLDTLLDPVVRVGTSTPRADPSGDYAFAMFAKAETFRPGARKVLEGKALQLTGRPASEKAPAGRNQYAWVMESGKADVFLTYCTNAVLAKKDLPALEIVQIAPDLNVSAEYGLIVLKDAPASATKLAQFILGKDGQAILVRHGFGRGASVK